MNKVLFYILLLLLLLLLLSVTTFRFFNKSLEEERLMSFRSIGNTQILFLYCFVITVHWSLLAAQFKYRHNYKSLYGL